MSRAALTIVEPSGPLTLRLGAAAPVQSEPVALEAALVADGRDVSSEATFRIEAAREILVYYTGFVRLKKPDVTGVDQLAWLFACYHHGPSSLKSTTVPTADEYAKAILGFMAERPWEGLIR